jgi:signal peptidase I
MKNDLQKFSWGVFAPFGAYFFARRLWGSAIVSLLLLGYIFSLGGNFTIIDIVLWVLFSIWAGFRSPRKILKTVVWKDRESFGKSEKFWTTVGICSIVFLALYLALGIGPIGLAASIWIGSLSEIIWISSLVFVVLLFLFFKLVLKFNIRILLKGLIVALVLCMALPLPNIVTRAYIMQPFYVAGDAMNPTLKNNDYLIVNEITPRFNQYHRGDMVVFRYPKNPAFSFVKRVIGLPGERVEIRNDGGVYINGVKIVEPYIAGDTPTLTDKTMGDDEYFVMGDNRHNSSDSRIWGPVSRDLMIGRVWVIIYPFENFLKIHTPSYGEGL